MHTPCAPCMRQRAPAPRGKFQSLMPELRDLARVSGAGRSGRRKLAAPLTSDRPRPPPSSPSTPSEHQSTPAPPHAAHSAQPAHAARVPRVPNPASSFQLAVRGVQSAERGAGTPPPPYAHCRSKLPARSPLPRCARMLTCWRLWTHPQPAADCVDSLVGQGRRRGLPTRPSLRA